VGSKNPQRIMELIQIDTTGTLDSNAILEFDLQGKTLEEQVKLSILRDLWKLNWQIRFNNGKVEIVPPKFYNKETIKESMGFKRDEIIRNNNKWIDKNIHLARHNLADGYSVLRSKINPIIEVCEKEKQHRLFRILRYYWSSPYSEYVGRRIKLIIRDSSLPSHPVIGIAALGSPIIHIPERDEFIGWDVKTRTKNLIYAMDAYVIGALPPYNYILGGKLISYLLASNEIREIYSSKYHDQITLMNKRNAYDLACLFTTSLYGKSSQYNRLKFRNELLYRPIGETKGYGTLHLTEGTIGLMRKLLKEKGIEVGYKFGDGPSWRMRLIRIVGDILDFDSDFLLKHSFRRTIYYIPLAKNSTEFLQGKSKNLKYHNWSKAKLTDYWRDRWLKNRKKNLSVINQVLAFNPNEFEIY
jgi:hypothetical protein